MAEEQNLNANPQEEEIATEKKESSQTEVADDISPIEEAKKINEENRKVLEELRKERLKIEKATAEMLVGGKSLGTKEARKETKEEIAQRMANEITGAFRGNGQ